MLDSITDRSSPAIGGYFGLELSAELGEFHGGALRYQSARAAFLALLRSGRPAAVWLPWYVCDSMLEPLRQAGIPVIRYRLDGQLRVLDAHLKKDEWLVYVNYFGISDRNVEDTLSRFPPEQIVIDNSQAFFAAPANCLANLYSPRKFFGVPDGGYLVTGLAMQEPATEDQGSLPRCAHLLQRLGGKTEKGYLDFKTAEASLSCQEPMRMSALTQAMLRRIPYPEISIARRRNAALLHLYLGASNRFPIAWSPQAVPLCYPYRAGQGRETQDLPARRVYLPSYWREVATALMAPSFERRLASDTLFLPCDQRLDSTAIGRLLQVLAVHTPSQPSATSGPNP